MKNGEHGNNTPVAAGRQLLKKKGSGIRPLLVHIHAALTDDGSTTLPAAFLLLLNSIVFEDDMRERFTVCCDARSMFALDIEGPYNALEASLGSSLAEMRKGGADGNG